MCTYLEYVVNGLLEEVLRFFLTYVETVYAVRLRDDIHTWPIAGRMVE